MICFFAQLLLYHEHDNKRIYTYWYHWLVLPSSVSNAAGLRCTCVRLLMSTSLNNRKNNLKWFYYSNTTNAFLLMMSVPLMTAAVFCCARLYSFSVYYQWYQHMLRCWINNWNNIKIKQSCLVPELNITNQQINSLYFTWKEIP